MFEVVVRGVCFVTTTSRATFAAGLLVLLGVELGLLLGCCVTGFEAAVARGVGVFLASDLGSHSDWFEEFESFFGGSFAPSWDSSLHWEKALR